MIMSQILCQGCRTVYTSIPKESQCKHIPYINGNYCPCIICLITSMCNDGCNEYFKYLNLLQIEGLV